MEWFFFLALKKVNNISVDCSVPQFSTSLCIHVLWYVASQFLLSRGVYLLTPWIWAIPVTCTDLWNAVKLMCVFQSLDLKKPGMLLFSLFLLYLFRDSMPRLACSKVKCVEWSRFGLLVPNLGGSRMRVEGDYIHVHIAWESFLGVTIKNMLASLWVKTLYPLNMWSFTCFENPWDRGSQIVAT